MDGFDYYVELDSIIENQQTIIDNLAELTNELIVANYYLFNTLVLLGGITFCLIIWNVFKRFLQTY